MTRLWMAASALVVFVVASILVLTTLSREREYQRLMAEGDAALADEQTYVAIEAYSGAIALKNDAMIAYLKRGETYRRRGELDAALRDLRAAARLDPQATRPAELLGDVNHALERYDRAAESYRACAELDDRNPRILCKLGIALYRAGDATGALLPLRKAINLDDRFGEAHYVLGLCLHARGQTREATEAFEEAVRLAPALVAAREELAAGYRLAGRTREAIAQLEAVAALEPDRVDRQVAVGLAYARAGRTDIAVTLLGRAAEQYPNSVGIYQALGRVWLDAAEPRRDRVALRKAVEALEPLSRQPGASSETLGLYGRALLAGGDIAAAEAALLQSSRTLPIDLDALLWLSVASERLRHWESAADALARWVALAPETQSRRASVLERLGDARQRLGDADRALRAWQQAAATADVSVALLAKLAAAEIAAGQGEAARRTIGRGLERDPGNGALLALQRRTKEPVVPR
ncbi:MAG: tetratricopeptide repeat protein [Acidobacteriota bacterium]